MTHKQDMQGRPPNQDTEVDEEVLQILKALLRAHSKGFTIDPTIFQAKTALNLYYKSILLEVIGADEDYSSETFDWEDQKLQAERNKLRFELRQRLESRLG